MYVQNHNIIIQCYTSLELLDPPECGIALAPLRLSAGGRLGTVVVTLPVTWTL